MRVWNRRIGIVFLAAGLATLASGCVNGGAMGARPFPLGRGIPAAEVAFNQLFPGFAYDNSQVASDGEKASDHMVNEFHLARNGGGIFPVLFSKDRSQAGDPIAGAPILSVPAKDGGAYYLADNYFVVSPKSRFSAIPRDQKLALWDAFFSTGPGKVRILGVFPISMLQRRKLLAPDGYAPKDLDGATIVVYTSDMESAITEEVPWTTADELVQGAREYEASDGPQNRLRVLAFKWKNGGWQESHGAMSPTP